MIIIIAHRFISNFCSTKVEGLQACHPKPRSSEDGSNVPSVSVKRSGTVCLWLVLINKNYQKNLMTRLGVSVVMALGTGNAWHICLLYNTWRKNLFQVGCWSNHNANTNTSTEHQTWNDPLWLSSCWRKINTLWFIMTALLVKKNRYRSSPTTSSTSQNIMNTDTYMLYISYLLNRLSLTGGPLGDNVLNFGGGARCWVGVTILSGKSFCRDLWLAFGEIWFLFCLFLEYKRMKFTICLLYLHVYR